MAREGIRPRRRNDGTIAYQALWQDAGGQQRSKTLDSEKAAVAYRARMLLLVAEGGVVSDNRMTFAQVCARFLETYQPKKEASWLLRERDIRLHLLPAFGAMKLAKLSGLDIDRWLARCRTEPTVRSRHRAGDPPDAIASPRSVYIWVSTLRMILRQAVKWRLIPRSPLDDATPPPAPEQGTVAHWREEDAARFFAHDPDHVDWPLWVVLATCQLRISEALALRWSDVDFTRGVLRVERGLSKVRAGGVIETSPKTRSSRRAVTMPPETVAALRLQQDRQEARKIALGRLWRGKDVPGWVFDNGFGVRLSRSTFDDRLGKATKAAGVPPMASHGFRHSGATAMARSGVPVRVLADRLGHANTTITQMVYSHFRSEDQTPHADAFAGRILGKREAG